MKYEVAIANFIPDHMRELTNGSSGTMQWWLETYKQDMSAVIALDTIEEVTFPVGWCAYRILENNIVEVGTYVHVSYRRKKLAMTLLDKAMFLLSVEIPGATVRYGGALYPEYHETYDRTIKKHNLIPDHWF